MLGKEDNQEIINEVLKLLKDNKELKEELLKDFVTYWTIKKSPSIMQTNMMERLEPNDWLNLIASNHKFREIYGDNLAKELIKIIELDSHETSNLK